MLHLQEEILIAGKSKSMVMILMMISFISVSSGGERMAGYRNVLL